MPSLPDLDVVRIRAYCEHRVPEHVRDQVRVEATVRGRSVTVFECRPPWRPSFIEWSRTPIAQLRYSTDTGEWSLFWADRHGRWHPYDLVPPGTVAELLDELERDPVAIFWG
jgi:hypothetical protein